MSQAARSASYTLVISCPDKVGIVAAVSRFVADRGGSLTESNHHTDVEQGWFFMRNVISAKSLTIDLKQFREQFGDCRWSDWRAASFCTRGGRRSRGFVK